MKLSKLLSADRIILDMKAHEHWAAITELVDHLVGSGGLPQAQRAPILAALKAREDLVSTGIGSGVAIPHAFSNEIDEVVAIFGRSKVGLDFEALDHSPVHFIVLFVVPGIDYHLHLRTLASIAKMFTKGEVRRQLAAAETNDDILAILAARPSRVVPPGA